MNEHVGRPAALMAAPAAVGVDVPGTPGNDAMVGDLIVPDGERAVLGAAAGNGNDTVPGTDGETRTAFRDSIVALAGDDEIVGDVLSGDETDVQLNVGAGLGGTAYFQDGGAGGNDARCSAFNDTLRGGAGADTLVGDVLHRGAGFGQFSVQAGTGVSGYYSAGGAAGDRNTAIGNNDLVFGSGEGDLLVGDVFNEDAGGFVLQANAGDGAFENRFFFGQDGGDSNTVRAFNDHLIGDVGADDLVGDILAKSLPGPSSGTTVGLAARAGAGGAGYNAADGGDGNRVVAFNDVLNGGTGEDVQTGDAESEQSFADLNLLAQAGDGGEGGTAFGAPGAGGDGGDNNSARAFGDTLLGGEGRDNLVGDLRLFSSAGDVSLTAGAGNSILSTAVSAGGGGDGDDAHGFIDEVRGGADEDVLVGDVWALDSFGTIVLQAAAGRGGDAGNYYYSPGGGPGGSRNTVTAFGDALLGEDGGDELVGDVDLLSVSANTRLSIVAGSGGDAEDVVPGGVGGDANVVAAFDDRLNGGDGNDLLVGDIRSSFSGDIDLHLSSGASGAASGGSGNTVRSFNDVLSGGADNDELTGDFVLLHTGVTIRIDGEAGNTIDAFRDYLGGGDGDDVLMGDINTRMSAAYTFDLQIDGDFDGRALLFADTLKGGRGDDVVEGGLGADSLSGGGGHDQFAWRAADLYDLASGSAAGAPPIDVVTDFRGDVLDLSSFDISISGNDVEDFVQARRLGADSVLSIDEDGSVGGADFDDFVVLRGVLTTVDDLVNSGQLLF